MLLVVCAASAAWTCRRSRRRRLCQRSTAARVFASQRFDRIRVEKSRNGLRLGRKLPHECNEVVRRKAEQSRSSPPTISPQISANVCQVKTGISRRRLETVPCRPRTGEKTSSPFPEHLLTCRHRWADAGHGVVVSEELAGDEGVFILRRERRDRGLRVGGGCWVVAVGGGGV